MTIFAHRLKELRIEQNRKPEEIADYLGISLRAYRYYESSTYYPDVPRFMRLADYLGVSMDYLSGRIDERDSWDGLPESEQTLENDLLEY